MNLVNIQVAMILDELPNDVLKQIEEGQQSLETITLALRADGVKLAGYFDKITDPEAQIKFTAEHIFNYFEGRRARKSQTQTQTKKVLNREDFMKVLEIIVEHSGGKIRIAHNEADESDEKELQAQHFLKVDGKRFGRDMETYDFMASINPAQALPDFAEIVLSIKKDFPESYQHAVVLMKELGQRVYEGRPDLIVSWNGIF